MPLADAKTSGTWPVQVMTYAPVPCKQCGAILNPYVRADFTTQVWTCPFCYGRNHFPAHYRGITPEVRNPGAAPAEDSVSTHEPRRRQPIEGASCLET